MGAIIRRLRCWLGLHRVRIIYTTKEAHLLRCVNCDYQSEIDRK